MSQIYETLYQQSIQTPEIFWGEQGKKWIDWIESWEKVLTGGFDKGDVAWYAGGKLNATYNCLDRHLPKRAEQVAILWEGNDPSQTQSLTYQVLYEKVCQLANALKTIGIQRGDRVCIYLPMIPEVIIAMLACARIGAIHSVVFAGFSADALEARILDAECSLVITANEGVRGSKIIPLKENVDKALQDQTQVKKVLVVKHTQTQVSMQERDSWYHEVIEKAEKRCEPAIMDAQDPLFILYTSGSTGRPKGILHGTGGYMVFAAMTFHWVFDFKSTDIYWCTADVGWITGHTYGVYGPLANGATMVMFEGIPSYPTYARYWEIIAKYRVSIFYTAPTAIRALRHEGDEWVKSSDRSSLRILGTVGEPINPEAWEWYNQIVGEARCPIVDTWWQTETGGIMLSALANTTNVKAGSVTGPFFGVTPQIVDDEGKVLPQGKMGKLVITTPWPGMMQTIYKDHQRFIEAYFTEFPGKYLTGDQAYQDDQGYYWILGRSDDVIKVSGHRIGTEEVESALMRHYAVSEAAVVGVPDDIKGQSIYAFVLLKSGTKATSELQQALMQTVIKEIGSIAVPKTIQFTQGLPKTRSGKIMRRILRHIAQDETKDLGDLSTLAEPQIIESLIKERAKLKI